jgi:hypothetical protein
MTPTAIQAGAPFRVQTRLNAVWNEIAARLRAKIASLRKALRGKSLRRDAIFARADRSKTPGAGMRKALFATIM